jgi:hypothetical protein
VAALNRLWRLCLAEHSEPADERAGHTANIGDPGARRTSCPSRSSCAQCQQDGGCPLPAAMLSRWKHGRITWRDVRPLIPFFAIGLALAWNTTVMERTRVGAFGAEWSFSVAERMLIAGRAVWFYASKLIWPANLTFIYPRWAIDAGDWTQWLYPIGAGVIVAGAFALARRLGRGPLVAIFFFGGTLVPALGFERLPDAVFVCRRPLQYVAGVASSP